MLFLVVVLCSAFKLLLSFVLWVCWFELVRISLLLIFLFKIIIWSFVRSSCFCLFNCFLFLKLFLGFGFLFDPYECDCSLFLDDFLCA